MWGCSGSFSLYPVGPLPLGHFITKYEAYISKTLGFMDFYIRAVLSVLGLFWAVFGTLRAAHGGVLVWLAATLQPSVL